MNFSTCDDKGSLRWRISKMPIFARKVGDWMIKLTRLDGQAFILNADLIRYVDERPDTFITLTSGDRIVVLESMHDVMSAAVDYQRSKHLTPPLQP